MMVEKICEIYDTTRIYEPNEHRHHIICNRCNKIILKTPLSDKDMIDKIRHALIRHFVKCTLKHKKISGYESKYLKAMLLDVI